jgi:hypothetical protein
MINNPRQLKKILEKIELGKHTAQDLDIIREALKLDRNESLSIQIGSNNINIGTANDINIQNIYNGLKPEIIRKTFGELLEQPENVRDRLIKKLRQFERTNRCFELLNNPQKFGFISTYKLLLFYSIILLFLSCVLYIIVSDLTSYNIDFFKKIKNLILIIYLILILYFIGQIIKYSSKIYRGEHITKTKQLYAIPVVVIRIHRTDDRLTRVAFSDSHNRPYYAVPHSNFDGSIICETDLGVAYLQKKKSNTECDAKYVLVGFEL